MRDRAKIFKKACVSWVGDNLHSCVPWSIELEMFFWAELPKWRPIESSGVNADQLEDKLRVIISKLLLHLVDTVIQDCSLAQQVSLGLRGDWGNVQLAGQMVSQVRVCKSPLSVQFNYSKYLMWWPIYKRTLGNHFFSSKNIFGGLSKGGQPKKSGISKFS